MNTTASPFRHSVQTFGHALMQAVGRVIGRTAAIATAMRHRREVRQLCTWDDGMLKDIGLTRSDVVGALSEPLSRDPSAVLVAQFGRRRGGARCPQAVLGTKGRQ